jgi:small subunit ribosomal protein S8
MLISNPIYDMLTRINNGQLARKNYIYQPKNKLCLKILKIIYQEGYIQHYSCINDKTIKIWLKYLHASPVIKNLRFFSTKNNSVFLSLNQLWKMDSDLKLFILATTKGFLSGKKSRKLKLGGKLICVIG